MDYTCEEDRRQEKSLIGKSVQLLHDYQCYGASRHDKVFIYTRLLSWTKRLRAYSL